MYSAYNVADPYGAEEEDSATSYENQFKTHGSAQDFAAAVDADVMYRDEEVPVREVAPTVYSPILPPEQQQQQQSGHVPPPPSMASAPPPMSSAPTSATGIAAGSKSRQNNWRNNQARHPPSNSMSQSQSQHRNKSSVRDTKEKSKENKGRERFESDEGGELTAEEREQLRRLVQSTTSRNASCWTRAWSKRRDIAKLLVLACVVVLALGTNAAAVHYIDRATSSSRDIPRYAEVAIRIAYPAVVILVMWILKMYVSH